MRKKLLVAAVCLLAWNSAKGGTEKKVLRVVYNEKFFPFSYRKESKLQGLEIDLTQELASRMDLDAVHQGYPWERAQAMVAEGKADAFVTVVTPERLKYSIMSSNSFFKVNIVAATSKQNPRLNALMEITDLNEALQYTHVNSIGSGWAKKFLGTARITYIASPDSIFKFLLANRADLYVESENSIRLNSQRLQLQDKIVILPNVLSTVEFRLGISQRSPLAAQMKSFDDTIKKMHDDGTSARIFKKWLNDGID